MVKNPKIAKQKPPKKAVAKRKTSVQKLSVDVEAKIRDLYVQGAEGPNGALSYPTIEGMATKFNVAEMTLHRRSRENGWKEQREEWAQDLQQERDKKKRQELVNKAVDFDSLNLKIAMSIQAQIVDVLNLAQKKTEERRGDPEYDVDGTYRFLSLSGINSLSSALAQTQQVGRLALGQSTENMNVSGTQNIRHEVGELFNTLREIASDTGRLPGPNKIIEHIQ